MKRENLKIYKCFLLTILIVTSNSCIIDEFKFNDIKLKDDWEMEVVIPLLTGQFEFKDLVYDWSDGIPAINNQSTSLLFSNKSTLEIPTQLLFEPAIIIDSLIFLINGDDYLEKAAFKYIVNNGSPLPLNIKMHFFDSASPNKKGPEFLPPSFGEGTITENSVTPLSTTQNLELNSEQLLSFKRSNRIEISTWFSTGNSGISLDSLSAHYPIHLSIVLTGTMQNEYE